MDSPDITVKTKFLAIRRAQWRLKQRLETIDFEKTLKEEVETLMASPTQGELPTITLEEK